MTAPVVAAARPRFPRSFRLRAASAALMASVLPPARVPVLAASSWPPRVLVLVLVTPDNTALNLHLNLLLYSVRYRCCCRLLLHAATA